jgi:hypothetical protein
MLFLVPQILPILQAYLADTRRARRRRIQRTVAEADLLEQALTNQVLAAADSPVREAATSQAIQAVVIPAVQAIINQAARAAATNQAIHPASTRPTILVPVEHFRQEPATEPVSSNGPAARAFPRESSDAMAFLPENSAGATPLDRARQPTAVLPEQVIQAVLPELHTPQELLQVVVQVLEFTQAQDRAAADFQQVFHKAAQLQALHQRAHSQLAAVPIWQAATILQAILV